MLMHSICQIFTPGAIVISDWRGPDQIDAEERWVRPLVGCAVYQAMNDGMLRIRIGVDRESGEPFMKYFGPIDYDCAKRIWWDMVPPPARCYPRMLQMCLSLARLRDAIPISGVIPAVKDRERLNLHLAVREIESFEVAWDEEHAVHDSGDRRAIDQRGRKDEDDNDSAKDHPGGEGLVEDR